MRNLKRYDAGGLERSGVGTRGHFGAAAERTSQRFRRRIVAHRCAALVTTKAHRAGLLLRLAHVDVGAEPRRINPVGVFRSAVATEKVLQIQVRSADRTSSFRNHQFPPG